MQLSFTKMQGLGNDYIYVDASRFSIADPAALSIRLSDRHFGIGSDGLVLIGPGRDADFSMRMFNADGSEGKMCGNAARCIARYVYEKGLTDKNVITLETASGIKVLRLNFAASGKLDSVTVDMGEYELIERAPAGVQACGREWRGVGVSMGNPHYVIFVDDAEAVDVAAVGSVIERLPVFPGGTNVEFVSRLADGRLRMRVWERGSGITLACGTGACATAAAASLRGIPTSPVALVMDGGTLGISVSGRQILMTGPAVTVFDGTIEI
ncbi:MAG: diaminopimelate epimerase [Bacteroidales bacterium]|nr:diaminopimelate epimerase [Bacteroidales bacterium]